MNWLSLSSQCAMGEPWRRHLTTEPQVNSPIEGLSALPATTTTMPASIKLRMIIIGTSHSSHFPWPSARCCLHPSLLPFLTLFLDHQRPPAAPGCPRVKDPPSDQRHCRPMVPQMSSEFSHLILFFSFLKYLTTWKQTNTCTYSRLSISTVKVPVFCLRRVALVRVSVYSKTNKQTNKKPN